MDKTRKFVIGILMAAVLAVAGVAAYARWYSFVLESKDAFRLNVLETHDTTGTVVRVSGICGPALSVKKITTKSDNATILVLVHAMLTRSGTQGWFEYDVPVPDSVSEIRFGKSKTLIWARH